MSRRKKNLGHKTLSEGQVPRRFLRFCNSHGKRDHVDEVLSGSVVRPHWADFHLYEYMSEEEVSHQIMDGGFLYCGEYESDCEGCHDHNLKVAIWSTTSWGDVFGEAELSKGRSQVQVSVPATHKTLRANSAKLKEKLDRFWSWKYCRDGLPPLTFKERQLFKELTEDSDSLDLWGGPWSCHSLIEILVRLHDFWIRPLEDFMSLPRSRRTDDALVEHLLFLYPVPSVLNQALSQPKSKWWLWMVIYGQGGSLKTLGSLYGWNLSKNFSRYFVSASADLPPHQTVRWAEVKRLGGTEVDVLRSESLLERLDPTEPTEEGGPGRLDLDFWYDSVQWMIRHREEMTDEEWRLIDRWASHARSEAERLGRRFSWKGRTVAASLRQAIAYQEELRARETYGSLSQPEEDESWPAQGWDREFNVVGVGVYSIEELTTSLELRQEGSAMHHCVGGYSRTCAYGSSAIFSVRLNGFRKLTVEVNLSQRCIIQAKGKYNRSPFPEEWELLERWKQTVMGKVE